MKSRFIKKSILFLLIIPFAYSLNAQTWVGGGTNWNDPANWSTNPSLPSNGSTIYIDGLTATVDVPSGFRPGEIRILNGGELIVSNTFDVASDAYTYIDGSGSKLAVTSGGLFTAEFITSTNGGEIEITGGELDVNDQILMSDGVFNISGGLLDYNGSTGEELRLNNSDFNMTAGTLEFNRGIIVTGGTFDLEDGATMTATNTARNIEFHSANAVLDGAINNAAGDLSLFGTSEVDLQSNLTMSLDDLVLNDDGQSSVLNIYGNLTAFDDLKFDEDPPDDYPNDNDQVNVKVGGTLEVQGTFRDISSIDPTININVEGDGTNGGTLTIAGLEAGHDPEDVYGTLVTSQDGARVSMEGQTQLPVVLLSFSATENRNGIDLKWSTAVEINNDYFDILRSDNGQNFITIARVDGFGNTNDIIEYSYIDRDLSHGTYFYQLKQVDFNGDFEYHHIINASIQSNLKNSISVSPNPISANQITLTADSELTEPTLSIYSLSGRLVIEKSLNSSNKWFFSKSELKLSAGTYILKIKDGLTGSSFDSIKIAVVE